MKKRGKIVYRIFAFGKEIGFTLNFSTAIMKERELRKIFGEDNVEVKEEEF